MPYSRVIEDVRKAIALEKPSRMPVFANSEEFDVKWYGKYCYEEICQSGEKMAEVWSAAIKEFDYDWAWLQIDDCFVMEPLGVGCYGQGDILRATKDYLPAARETLKNLPTLDPAKDGRMPAKLKAIQLLRDKFGDTVLVTGGVEAPYSSVGLMWGVEETMIAGLTDPDLLAEACEYFVDIQYRFAKAQYDAGAHAVWLGDCNAFSTMLSLEQYNKFAFGACKKLVAKIKENTDMIVWLHNSEIQIPNLLSEAQLGVDIINAGPAANMTEVRKAMTGKNCFTGNLDPIEMLMRGTPEQIDADVKRIIDICADAGGFLFSTGEMNPRDVPEENIRAYSAAVRKYGKM